MTRFDCEFPEVPFGSKDADLRNFLVGTNLELGRIELGSHPCSSIFKKKDRHLTILPDVQLPIAGLTDQWAVALARTFGR